MYAAGCRAFRLFFIVAIAICGLTSTAGAEQPSPAAVAGFNLYIDQLEARIEQHHRSAQIFLAGAPGNRLRDGEPIIEKLTPAQGTDLPGALLHHWRGTAFVAGATAADFERVLKDFSAYPKTFSPQVIRARVIAQHGDHFQVVMRVKQHHVITVVMDTAYDVSFGRLDTLHQYSASRSTQILEIASPGTDKERVLAPGEAHGFMWRLNTYWTYEERDGGLYMQIESVSLTRSIPTGLGWVVGPFVQSIPRESLEFTLRSASRALRK